MTAPYRWHGATKSRVAGRGIVHIVVLLLTTEGRRKGGLSISRTV